MKKVIAPIFCFVLSVLFLSNLFIASGWDNLKSAKDIALNNLEALSEEESGGSTTIKKFVLSSDFIKNDSGTYYLICKSGTTSSIAYECPTFAQEGRVDAFYAYYYCTK